MLVPNNRCILISDHVALGGRVLLNIGNIDFNDQIHSSGKSKRILQVIRWVLQRIAIKVLQFLIYLNFYDLD